MDEGGTRVIPFYTLVPPHALLLDIAGPLEVIRYANGEQRDIHFDCRYIAASDEQQTSIGLALARLESLPATLPENALLLISGSTSRFDSDPGTQRERQALATWLRRAVRPDTTAISICSGALLAGEAGLFDGRNCTTHADCIEATPHCAIVTGGRKPPFRRGRQPFLQRRYFHRHRPDAACGLPADIACGCGTHRQNHGGLSQA